MSRHGYIDDADDYWELIKYRGAVASAIRGKKGQEFLHALRTALDAMPEKRLILHELVDEEGSCCAIGSLCKFMGLDVSKVDPEEPEAVAALFGVNDKIIREIAWENDDYVPAYGGDNWDSQEKRWKHMREWVERHIAT